MNIPDDRRYRESHEWARQQGDLVTVGISDYAQDQLGDVVFVELPAPGRKVEAGEPIAVVESVKTASDIYAPLAGEVIEVNDSLVDSPELINGSPYEDGWMFRIRPAADASLTTLLDAAGYEAVIEEEA